MCYTITQVEIVIIINMDEANLINESELKDYKILYYNKTELMVNYFVNESLNVSKETIVFREFLRSLQEKVSFLLILFGFEY